MMKLAFICACILVASCGGGGGGGSLAAPVATPPPTIVLPPGHPGQGTYTATLLGLPWGAAFAGEPATTSATFGASTVTIYTAKLGALTVPWPNGTATGSDGLPYVVTYDPSTQRIDVRRSTQAGAVWSIAVPVPIPSTNG
jgi:hypothetical protein